MGNPMKPTCTSGMSLLLAVAMVLLTVAPTDAKVRFRESAVHGPGEDLVFCDLDGDGLKDFVLPDGVDLHVFYQDARKGFAEKADRVYHVGDRPALCWPAKLGPGAESLLVMTSDGVTELNFANHDTPPVHRQIIAQRTIMPESVESPSIAYFPLSPRMGANAPVILVPAGGDLQVWRHTDAWRRTQTLQGVLETAIRASRDDLGYDRDAELTVSLGDVTGDQRDDIILRTSFLPQCGYAVYAQNQDGSFAADPHLDVGRKVGLVVALLGGHQSRRTRRPDQEHLARRCVVPPRDALRQGACGDLQGR